MPFIHCPEGDEIDHLDLSNFWIERIRFMDFLDFSAFPLAILLILLVLQYGQRGSNYAD